MAEPSEILTAIESLFCSGGKRDLVGKQILVSAGGTQEYLDPVRFIGNPSTGKMGIAIAIAAQHRGASVTLVHGPLTESLSKSLRSLETISVVSALAMEKAMIEKFSQSDWTIMAAAVADVMPEVYAAQKLAKSELPAALALKPVPDIVTQLGQMKRPTQILVGFAAQTGEIIAPAQEKLARKQLDLIVANPVDRLDSGFGSDINQAVFLHRNGDQLKIAPCQKLELAHRLLDFIQQQRFQKG